MALAALTTRAPQAPPGSAEQRGTSTSRVQPLPAMSGRGGGRPLTGQPLGLGPVYKPATQSLRPPSLRAPTNTSKVHQVKQPPAGQDEALQQEAQSVSHRWWEEVTQNASLPSQSPNPLDNTRAIELLHVLLPCLREAVESRALTEAALRAVADEIPHISLSRLDEQEQKLLGLFQGVLSRSVDTEPEDRGSRNALVRLIWEGFGEARTTGRLDPWQRAVSPALHTYRDNHRKRTLRSLYRLVSMTVEDPKSMGTRIVLLRSLVGGSLSHVLLSQPSMLRVPLRDLQKRAGAAVGTVEDSRMRDLIDMARQTDPTELAHMLMGDTHTQPESPGTGIDNNNKSASSNLAVWQVVVARGRPLPSLCGHLALCLMGGRHPEWGSKQATTDTSLG